MSVTPSITDTKAYSGATASLSGSINATSGDLVIACLSIRSALTVPEGWTMVYDGPVFDTGNDCVNQMVKILVRVADTTGSYTFVANTAASSYAYLNLISLSNCAALSVDTVNTMNLPTRPTVVQCPDKVAGRPRIWLFSSNYGGSNYTSTMSPDDCIFTAVPAASAPRLFTWIDTGTGAATARSISTTNGTGDGAYGTLIAIDMIMAAYKPSGTAEYSTNAFKTITAAKDSSISWAASIPENTAINVYAKKDNGEYALCSNEATIPCIVAGDDLSASTIFVKAELTSNGNSTPELSDLVLNVK